MPDKAWKHYERWVAEQLGGTRRGPTVVDDKGNGTNDIILPGWSVECKKLKQPAHAQMVKAERQAEAAIEEEGDFPIVCLSKKQKPYDHSLVIMRFDEFKKLFDLVSSIHPAGQYPSCRE